MENSYYLVENTLGSYYSKFLVATLASEHVLFIAYFPLPSFCIGRTLALPLVKMRRKYLCVNALCE